MFLLSRFSSLCFVRCWLDILFSYCAFVIGNISSSRKKINIRERKKIFCMKQQVILCHFKNPIQNVIDQSRKVRLSTKSAAFIMCVWVFLIRCACPAVLDNNYRSVRQNKVSWSSWGWVGRSSSSCYFPACLFLKSPKASDLKRIICTWYNPRRLGWTFASVDQKHSDRTEEIRSFDWFKVIHRFKKIIF